MKILQFFFLLLLCSCKNHERLNPIENALQSKNTHIKNVVEQIEDYEVQIMLSKIHREEDQIYFEDFEFRVNDSVYFYPASTVKLPIAILTLEKLNQQDSISIDTPFFIEGDTITSTFRADITDIFAVSSNDTYNRLFEFLGKDNINKNLNDKDITPTRISHRLSTDNAYELITKPIIFSKNDSTLFTSQSIYNTEIKHLELEHIKKGIGYYSKGELISEPMDFSLKNYYPIKAQHEIMKRIFFPEVFEKHQRFDLSDTQYIFLRETMAVIPKTVGYDPKTYYDSYVKFFMFGDSKKPIPSHIKIHNKVGYAYGYLTDNAYIIDTKNNVEYILTATIHVNANKIYNDDTYEYETVGIPFLAALGREIHHQIMSAK